jgi:hypothetical protein
MKFAKRYKWIAGLVLLLVAVAKVVSAKKAYKASETADRDGLPQDC